MDMILEVPADLKMKAEQAATARGVSLDEFIRQALEWAVAQDDALDPLFADEVVYPGNAPVDLSANHDQYLYRDTP